MTETTEETIARLAKERAKTILENSDYWSGPGPAKTSAEAVGTLLSYRWQLEPAIPPAELPLVAEEPPQQVEAPKPKRQPKESPAPVTAPTDGEPEPADV